MATRVRFGGYQGDKSVHTRGAQVLCDALAESVGAAAEVEFVRNVVDDGRKASDLLDMTESGELDGCYFSSSYLAARVPELALFDQHFSAPDRRRAYAILDGSLGRRLAREIADRTGFVALGYWDNGLRHLSSADTPFRRPADCRGLKLRTLPSDDHRRVFRALGFEPVAIDVRDLPDAVASGRVDAQENPLTNIYNFGLHETHRIVTLTGHLLGVALVLFNRARVEGWPSGLQAAVKAAVATSVAAQRRFAEEDDRICADALAKDGVALVELGEAERAAFAAAALAEVEKTRARFDERLIALFDEDLARAGAGRTPPRRERAL